MAFNIIKPETPRWFEYHCFESDQSADADLWYRSQQKVAVLECENISDFGDIPQRERYEGGTPLVYKIRFQDGHTGSAFEDELLYKRSQFSRPAPPHISTRMPATTASR